MVLPDYFFFADVAESNTFFAIFFSKNFGVSGYFYLFLFIYKKN